MPCTALNSSNSPATCRLFWLGCLKLAGAYLGLCNYQAAEAGGTLVLRGMDDVRSLPALLDALLPPRAPLSNLFIQQWQVLLDDVDDDDLQLGPCRQLAALRVLSLTDASGLSCARLADLLQRVTGLEQLLVKDCYCLRQLPDCLAAMRGLRHLRVVSCSLDALPEGPYLASEPQHHPLQCCCRPQLAADAPADAPPAAAAAAKLLLQCAAGTACHAWASWQHCLNALRLAVFSSTHCAPDLQHLAPQASSTSSCLTTNSGACRPPWQRPPPSASLLLAATVA